MTYPTNGYLTVNIAAILKERGWNKTEAAAKLDLAPNTILALHKNPQRIDLGTIEKIMRATGKRIEEILVVIDE